MPKNDDPTIFEVKVTVGGEKRKYHIELGKDLQISAISINRHLEEQPQQYAKVGTLWALVKSRREWQEMELEEMKSKLFGELKQQMVDDGMKEKDIKVTDLRNQVASSEDVLKKKQVIHKMREKEGMLNEARIAFSQRKDCLISLASNLREQYDSVLHINKDKAPKKGKKK